jgi:hypothetical protein
VADEMHLALALVDAGDGPFSLVRQGEGVLPVQGPVLAQP